MQLKREQVDETTVKLGIVAEQNELDRVKQHVLRDLSNDVKVPGFRPGKAPQNLVEKQLDQSVLQSEFLEHVVNDLYAAAVEQQIIRPVSQPKIELTKFVPFTTLEFTAEVEAIGEIKLPDYKQIKLASKPVNVTADEVNKVVNNLRQRAATKKEVNQPAKKGDEVVIDFKGIDAKTKKSIEGADGKDYSLVLGSGNFIPGFEENLVGLKSAEEKRFDIVFPEDYGVTELRSKKVNFTVKILKVHKLDEPKLDDKFASTVSLFKTLAELKADIKKQLTLEKTNENRRAYDNKLLERIAAKTDVSIPKALIDEEIDRLEEEEKRNIVYRGQTWQEHLDEEGLTAEQHREKNREMATLRVKSGLILGEIAQSEQINVTPEELKIRIQLLKGQYTDSAMQAELDKPENRRDIHSRMMTEKTLDKLRSYSQKH